MASKRAAFAILQDFATSAGLALHKVLEGDTRTGKNALAALIAKDSAGNLRYPKVDDQDRLLVSSNSGDTAALSARGFLNGGSLTSVLVTGATIPLVNDLVYKDVSYVVSCTRDTLFQIVQVDDVTETILADVMLEAGQSNASAVLPTITFTAGSSGTQAIKIVAINLDTASDVYATIAVTEVEA